MELCGESLQTIFDRDGPFTDGQALVALNNGLLALQAVHGFGILHRDVSPGNLILSNRGGRTLVKLCDFGLSKSYRDHTTGAHTPPQQNRGIVGTLRFCSLDVHEGKGVTRRSDLQSLAHSILLMYRGKLPWTGLRTKDERERKKQVHRLKRNNLWEGTEKSMMALRSVWKHTLGLGWSSVPAYNRLAAACE